MDITRTGQQPLQSHLKSFITRIPDELRLMILTSTASDHSARDAVAGLDKVKEHSDRLKEIVEHEAPLHTFMVHQREIFAAQARLSAESDIIKATPSRLSQVLRSQNPQALNAFIALPSLGDLSESDQMQLLAAVRKHSSPDERRWLTAGVAHQLPRLKPEVQRQLVYSVMQRDRHEPETFRSAGEMLEGFEFLGMTGDSRLALEHLAKHFSQLNGSEQQRLFALLVPADALSPTSPEAMKHLAAAGNHLSPAQQQTLFAHASRHPELLPALAAGVAHFKQPQVDMIASSLLADVHSGGDVFFPLLALMDAIKAMGSGITRLSTPHIQQMAQLIGHHELGDSMALYRALAPVAQQVPAEVHGRMLQVLATHPNEPFRLKTLAAMTPHIQQFRPEYQDMLTHLTLAANVSTDEQFAACLALGENYPYLSHASQSLVMRTISFCDEESAAVAGLVGGLGTFKGRLPEGSADANRMDDKFPWDAMIAHAEESHPVYAERALQALSSGLNERLASYLRR